MAKMDDIYTIQQLTEICECSIPVARKYVNRAKYKESTIHIKGRATKAYNIPIVALQTMKDTISRNKQKINAEVINNSATLSANQNTTQVRTNANILEDFENNITSKAQEYWQLYTQTKEELLRVQTDIKLIEDKAQNKEALYLKEIEDLKADKTRLEAQKKEIESKMSEVEESKTKLYKRWLITAGVLVFSVGVAVALLLVSITR